MQTLFRYNWQVREDWFHWCEEIDEKELLLKRTGGIGGILHTLFHIIDTEWSWIQLMQSKPDIVEDFTDYQSLSRIRELDAACRPEVEAFVQGWDASMENNIYEERQPDGSIITDTWGEIIRHVIAHEIHHIGQLSIWAREIGKKPVSANLLGRGLAPTIEGNSKNTSPL